MKHEQDHFLGFGNLGLYYQDWLPDSMPARAVIVMLHGDFAHSGWYMNLPQHQVPRGYAVYAYDRRGWGRSPGQRGYINRWDENGKTSTLSLNSYAPRSRTPRSF
ncbi:MAG: alpha/beta hydrolase [Anaerolineae bacterium]|nr:alpha/beta hydrolase [Anaerolineae bacterium]